MVNGNPVLDYWILFTSPLNMGNCILKYRGHDYIYPRCFLTWYANKARDVEATKLLRKYALIWALPTIITAGGIIVELRNHNPEHYSNIQNFWLMFLISFLMFIGTVWLIWKRRNYGLAFILLVGQFVFAFFGYGASHYPYLLYPYLTIYDSFTNPAMAISLIVVFIMGLGLADSVPVFVNAFVLV